MKKFIRKNKTVLFLLAIILVSSVVAIGIMLRYFYYGDGTSRTIAQNTMEISSSKLDEVKEALLAKEEVQEATVEIAPKSGIIVFRITFSDGYDLDKAKTVAAKTLESFSDEELALYDVTYTLISASSSKADGFKIMGSRNVAGSTLVWGNNNASTEEED